jgi:indole-3-acetate monooxygenase
MKQGYSMQELREKCLNAEIFPPTILNWIEQENLWNIWVPVSYGGLEMSLKEGLEKLRSLARIDGSLGWTVTLCSGANYFIGNLKKEVAREIFVDPQTSVCFGGSGGVFGTAEKTGQSYRISGKWKYATGAPYLTHFTLNARIHENGRELNNPDGSPKILSFLLPAEKVTIIEDWNSMGLKASATHSFEVKEEIVDEKYSFLYNHTYLPHPIFRIHFSVFADLTLWVNYIGMAESFVKEATPLIPTEKLRNLDLTLQNSIEMVDRFSNEIEIITKYDIGFKADYIENIHTTAANSVRTISRELISIYPSLGVKASRIDEGLNNTFRDYFTATQHHIFSQDR